MEEWLRIGAYVGSMLTSMIAAGASAVYWVDKRSKRRRLEDYLKGRRGSPHEAFSKTRLMADLGMTEAEIFAASFASRHIARGVRRDKATGFAAEVLFQYREEPENARERISSGPDLFVDESRLRVSDESSNGESK